jgi:ubiquitin C-terminal hydrolase
MEAVIESKLVSAADIQFFLKNESLLKEKSGLKSPHGNDNGLLVGLFNEGSTCYLNSVLQSLLHTSKFSNYLLQQNFVDDKSTEQQLKRLFANMLFSTKHASRTEELLQSFGWTKEQVFQQHDAHEFYSLLLDGLSISDTSAPAVENFYGQETRFMQCTECSYRHEQSNKFNCLSLEIPPFDRPVFAAIFVSDKPALRRTIILCLRASCAYRPQSNILLV